jgi:hypothetical protein
MEKAIEVKDVLVPIDNPKDSRGHLWLIFKYGESDKDPWKWPKVLKYQDKLYHWISWNSDNNSVNYKSISAKELATIVRKR